MVDVVGFFPSSDRAPLPPLFSEIITITTTKELLPLLNNLRGMNPDSDHLIPLYTPEIS